MICEFSFPPNHTRCGSAESPEEVDEFIRQNPEVDEITIWFDTGFRFRASLFRNKGRSQLLVQFDGLEKRFTVKCDDDPNGELVVCCREHGSCVPIEHIEVPFWDQEDFAVDRGLVWLMPKAHGKASFTLYPNVMSESQTASAIIEAARVALVDKILRHFSD